jgi:serine/threonine protein kinase
MGVIYEAVQMSLARRVALKVLPPAAISNPTHLARFRQEATEAARLHHTNIVPVYGLGECDGVHFYAMQFISGKSLRQLLDSRSARDSSVLPAGSDLVPFVARAGQQVTACLALSH